MRVEIIDDPAHSYGVVGEIEIYRPPGQKKDEFHYLILFPDGRNKMYRAKSLRPALSPIFPNMTMKGAIDSLEQSLSDNAQFLKEANHRIGRAKRELREAEMQYETLSLRRNDYETAIKVLKGQL